MLRHKYRMTTERRLFAVIGDQRRREAFIDEILGMREHYGQALGMQIVEIYPL